MMLTFRLNGIAERQPDKFALIVRGSLAGWKTITYRQLLHRVHRLARGLEAAGVKPGQRAALMIPPSADFFALTFALLNTGVVPVIVDPAIGMSNVTKCLEESQPEIFIGNILTHALRIWYGWGKNTIQHPLSLSRLLRVPVTASAPQPSPAIPPDSPAAIIYTSGSTGLPKGAVYTQENFSAQLDILVSTFRISQDEIDLPAFPLFALIDCLLGVTAIIPDMRFPPPSNVNPEKIVKGIRKYNVNNLFASPIVLDRLATYGIKWNIQLTSLTRVITAGAPTPVRVLERFRTLLPSDADLLGIYGATEALPNTIIDSEEILNETRHKSVQGAGICIGRPVKDACIRVIKISDGPITNWADSLEVGPNVVGEITVKGPAVTRAYAGGEQINQLAKIRDGDEIVHRMGDLGYFDEQGRLWFCGRKSHRVKTGDETLFTEQIEGIFNAHPRVYRTALVQVNKEPVLWIELEREAQAVDKQRIKRELVEIARNHPQASKIKTFLFVKRFPTDIRHNSKIIREKLAAAAEKRLG